METAATFVFSSLMTAVCLWVGMKLTTVDGSFPAMIIIAAISSLAALIPIVGGIASALVLFFLVCKWTDADLFPDAVLVVVVASVANA